MNRAASPVLATLLLTALAVAVAGAVGVLASGYVQEPAPAQPVEISASANASTGRIVLVHESGPPLDVRRVRVRISVRGTRLEHQPPVPFFGAPGYRGAPSGPFNAAAGPRWEVGERAGLRVAGTNHPDVVDGAIVRVELYRDDLPIARAETVAR